MKRILAMSLLVFCLVPVSSWSQSLTIEVQDKYLVGKGLVSYNKPVIQTYYFQPLFDGLYLNLWWGSGFNQNLNGGLDDEMDYGGGWSGNIHGVDVTIGVQYNNLVGLGRSSGDVFEPYFEFAKSFKLSDRHTLTPYFRPEVYVPIDWKGVKAKNGAQLFFGLKHWWHLFEVMDVRHQFAFDYDTGAFVGFDHGMLGDYKIALTWKLPKGITADIPTFRTVFPISHFNDGRKVHEVFGVGITIPYDAVKDLFK